MNIIKLIMDMYSYKSQHILILLIKNDLILHFV